MSQTECVARFTSHGREFMVLHKASAAYLRADGRMIASLGTVLGGWPIVIPLRMGAICVGCAVTF